MFNNQYYPFFDNAAAAADMATATKQSPSTTASSSPVPGSPQSPNNINNINNNNNSLNFHQLHHHLHHSSSSSLSSPGHIASYEYSQRIHQAGNRQPFVDTGNQEEISSIAKQISDHAEAIYQTWKARGLAPTEILNCQLSATAQSAAAATAGGHLDLVTSPAAHHPFQSRPSPPYPLQTMPLSTGGGGTGGGGGTAALNELLAQPPDMSNNNKLEKLVNSFVNEDKARIAAQRRSAAPSPISKKSTIGGSSGAESSPQPPPKSTTSSSNSSNSPGNSPTKKSTQANSTTSPTKKANGTANNNVSLPSLSSVSVIKQTLQKFENNNNNVSAKNFNLIKSPKSPQPPVVVAKLGSTVVVNGNGSPTGKEDRNNNTQDEESLVKRQLLKKNLLNSANNVPDVLLDTIHSSSTAKGSGSPVSPKPQTPVKPPNLLNHVPSWPIKSRSSGSSGSTNGSVVVVHEIHIEGRDSPDATTLKLGSDSGGGGGSGGDGGLRGGKKVAPGPHNTMKSKTTDNSEELMMISGNESSELVAAKRKGPVSAAAAPKKSPAQSSSAPSHNPQLMDEVKREEECLINALKSGQVLKSSALVSDSMLMMSESKKKSGRDQEAQQSLPAAVSAGGAAVVVNSSSSGSSNKNGLNDNNDRSSSDEGGDSGNLLSDNNDSDSVNSANFDRTTADVAGHPPSNLAHHVPKVWQNEDGVFEPVTTAQKPTISSKLIKARPVRSSVLETMMYNDAKEAKMGKAIAGLEPNPVRPFLTRGSVAERVLMFERCPEIKAPPRMPVKDPSKLAKAATANKSSLSHTTLQRHIKGSSKNVYIPRFHFPAGKPMTQIALETMTTRVHQVVHQFPNSTIPWDQFQKVVQVCQMPVYWKGPLFHCTELTANGCVDGYKFMDFFKHLILLCHDPPSKFVYILSKGNRQRQHILPEDLVPLVQDVVDTHPGLAFLKEAPEFHSRYVHTVIARIFYSVNRSWSGKITVPELRRSNLLQVIQLLEEEEDINQIMAFFSYEHFYVIYCKFWELDRDHDLYIDQNDLSRHNDHALSLRMIERIFCGCVTRGGAKNRNMGPNGPRITYTDFVWFLLSEEDKNNPTAMEYWFRCMDLDGDGILSLYELEYFYEEQQQRMESIGIETLPFQDCICQMLDMIKPMRQGCITLGDLKRCKMTSIFFDTFFNLEKYLDHEQRDPFATQRDCDDMSDWDRYAAQEYELLVAEEGGDTQGSYDEDEDYESNIDVLEQQLDEEGTTNGGGEVNEW